MYAVLADLAACRLDTQSDFRVAGCTPGGFDYRFRNNAEVAGVYI